MKTVLSGEWEIIPLNPQQHSINSSEEEKATPVVLKCLNVCYGDSWKLRAIRTCFVLIATCTICLIILSCKEKNDNRRLYFIVAAAVSGLIDACLLPLLFSWPPNYSKLCKRLEYTSFGNP